MTYESSYIQPFPSFNNINEFEDGTISLSDDDEDQIESMILTEEESKLKKNIWDSLNREWLVE